jgi:hypothetical protein
MSITPSLLNEIRQFHNEFTLAGSPNGNLLNLSDPVLSYLVSILRQKEPVFLPQISDEEWADLLHHLSYHGIIPLIYWQMTQFPAELRPPEIIISRMRDVFLRNNIYYQILVRQLRIIQDEFKKQGIRSLIFKGLALAWTVYPDFTTRPSGDIDLLVKPEQFVKAREVLIQIGYGYHFKRFEMYKEICKAEEFFHKKDEKKPLTIDLHWNLLHYYGIQRDNGFGDVFGRATDVKMPSLSFQTLDRVDALIYSALHLILNHPESRRLIWICDIALLAEKMVETKDWEILEKRTKALKADLAVENALKLACIWNGLQLPKKYREFSEWLRPTLAQKIELAFAETKNGPDIRLKGFLDIIGSAPNKISYLFKLIFPSAKYMQIVYPPSKTWLLPLSYIQRWGRWIGKLLYYIFNKLHRK